MHTHSPHAGHLKYHLTFDANSRSLPSLNRHFGASVNSVTRISGFFLLPVNVNITSGK